MQTYEVLAEACHASGARSLFTIMGDGNKLWLVAAARRGITLYHVRHEGAGLAMADGYARATGQVGLCSVTYSAGLTQLPTSLMVAARHRTPLVVLAGDLPAEHRGTGGQLDLDAPALVRASGGVPVPVRSPATAGQDVRIAFATARRQRRPVVLLAPLDLQEAPAPPAPPDPAPDPGLAWPDRPARIAAPPEAVAAAVELLTASHRPVILAGRGAVSSGAREQLVRLADRTGGLLATTLPAKGYLDHDPHSLGMAGSFADQRARRLLGQTDCVLAVGASLSAYTLATGDLFDGVPVIQVDLDPAGPDRTGHDRAVRRGPAPVPVPGDAATVLDQLLAELPEPAELLGVPEPAAARWRDRPEVKELLATDPRREAIEARPARLAPGTLDPRELMLALDPALAPDATVVIGVGNFSWFPLQYLRNPADRRFLATIDFVSIGQAVPTAIGAAVGRPDRPVVAFEGDASFMMHVQELETAARYGVPVLIFVLNDGALGAEYHKLTALGLNPRESILPSADVCEVAEALGARARRISDPGQVAAVWDWFDPAQGPHVVDCPVSRSVAGPA